MLKKEYESVILNNIINQLAYVRDEERKPYFPADLIIQKTIETCEYTIDKGVVRISSMQQATAMMKDLVNGKFGIYVRLQTVDC